MAFEKLGSLTKTAGKIRTGLSMARAGAGAVTRRSGSSSGQDIKDFLSEFQRSQSVLKSEDVQEGIRKSLEKQGKTFGDIEDHMSKLVAQEKSAADISELALSGKALSSGQVEELFKAFKEINTSLKLVSDTTRVDLKTEDQFNSITKALKDTNISETSRLRAFEDSKHLFEMIAQQSVENGEQDSNFAKKNAQLAQQLNRTNIASAEGIREIIELLQTAGKLSGKENSTVNTTFGAMNEKLGSLVVNSKQMQAQLVTSAILEKGKDKLLKGLEERITSPAATKNLGELLFGESFNELDDFLGISDKVSALKKGAIDRFRSSREKRTKPPRRLGRAARSIGGFLKSPTGLAVAGGALSLGLIAVAIKTAITEIGPTLGSIIGEKIADINPFMESKKEKQEGNLIQRRRSVLSRAAGVTSADRKLLIGAEQRERSGIFGASDLKASKRGITAAQELQKLRRIGGTEFKLPERLKELDAEDLIDELKKLNDQIEKQTQATMRGNQDVVSAVENSSNKGAVIIPED